MAEFKYNEKESLVWECTNCIVIENGDVQEQTNQEGVIITKEKNYSLENIYNKQYDEKELNIKQSLFPFIFSIFMTILILVIKNYLFIYNYIIYIRFCKQRR